MKEVIGASIIGVSVIIGARHVYRGLQGHAGALYEGMIRSALVSNFSRFGTFDPNKIVVMDDTRGYFIRDDALWVCEIKDDDVLPATARPVDLIHMDAQNLREVMAAVDTLNTAVDDLVEDEDD